MFRKTRNIVLVAGALAAVSVAGSAMASAGAAPATNGSAMNTIVARSAVHASKHRATGASAAAGDTETADGAGQAGQGNDTETADGPQGADQETGDGQESGSEVVENDGPGGHADEPANPNAEHEAGGQE
jgi:hypothetical protein